MANKHRNEISVNFAGKERILRATMDCIANIEGETHKGIIALIRDFTSGEFRVNSIVSVIFHGLRGADDTEMSVEQVAQTVLEMGLTNAYSIAIDFLNAVMGEPEGAPGKSLTTASA